MASTASSSAVGSRYAPARLSAFGNGSQVRQRGQWALPSRSAGLTNRICSSFVLHRRARADMVEQAEEGAADAVVSGAAGDSPQNAGGDGDGRPAGEAVGVEPRLMDQRRRFDRLLDRQWREALGRAERRLDGAEDLSARSETAVAAALPPLRRPEVSALIRVLVRPLCDLSPNFSRHRRGPLASKQVERAPARPRSTPGPRLPPAIRARPRRSSLRSRRGASSGRSS